MSLTRTLSSSLGCHGCRTAIVRSFISTTSTNSAIRSHPFLAVSSSFRPLRRSFTSSASWRQEKEGLSRLEREAQEDALRQLEQEAELEELRRSGEAELQPQIRYPVTVNPPPLESFQAETSSNVDSSEPPNINVPWYLRKTAETVAPQPAQIPDLPPNPPPLLETLLHYVSMTAGLDDLMLLDLRHLDPPPALGPKLIMIIGTARSEKHLHVSADRFCRWLRREHNLRANAAGLLGRNELKIKLRRKAKRMKMLANLGGQEPEGNLDDGIRTGWICCTVGKLEPHPEDTHMPGDDVENFVGFREVKPGVNVVVQMFVEEKRSEIDLETLWGGVMKTHEREGKMADKILEDLEKEDAEDELEQRREEEQPHSSVMRKPAAVPSSRTSSEPLPGDTPPSLSSRPTDPSPVSQWKRPLASAGDPFPSVSDLHSSRPRHMRRLHTLGLR